MASDNKFLISLNKDDKTGKGIQDLFSVSHQTDDLSTNFLFNVV